MLRSMTGYGESETTEGGCTYTCEARTVNGRFLAVSVRMPDSLQYLEPDVRKAVRERLTRGSVHITVRVNEEGALPSKVNMKVVDHYLSILGQIRKKTGSTRQPDPAILFTLPGVIGDADPCTAPRAKEVVLSLVNRSLELVTAMRIEEGRHLTADLTQRLDKIEQYVSRVSERSVQSVQEKREVLRKKVEEFLTEYDRERLNLEILTQIEKFDVQEELVRLRSHLDHFRGMLAEPPPAGSKLTYLTQEMQREANTLTVKSMDAEISHTIVLLKEELERIREQLQNVE